MNGYRGTPQDLTARFGLSARLRARIGALYAQRVDVSEAALEMAGAGSPLEGLLLAAALLTGLKSLDDSALAAIAAAGGVSLAAPLAVLDGADGWRTIALAEERQSQEGFDAVSRPEPAEAPHGALTLAPLVESIALPAGELEKARWTLLTGVDPAAKVEAIRVISLAPLPLETLGQLLVRALGDESGVVKGEAASAFARLGIDPEIAETCRRLLSGDAPEQCLAVDRLARLFDETRAEHRPLVVVVLVRALGGGPTPAVRDAVLDALAEIWPRVAASTEGTLELLRVLVGQLGLALVEVASRARRLLLLVGNAAQAGLVADHLVRESARTGTASQRRFLLSVAGELELPALLLKDVANRLAAEIDRGVDLDPIYLRMETTLAHLGIHALDALLARLESERSTEVRLLLIGLLDQICREAAGRLKPADKNRVLEAFLATYQVAPQRVRESVITVRLFSDPALGKKVRARMAGELLATVHNWKLDRVTSDVTGAICSLGEPALEPIMEALGEVSSAARREIAARMLGEVASRLDPAVPEHTAAARRALDFCATRISDPACEDKGELLASWGRIASRGDLARDEVAAVVEGLRARVWGSSHTYRVLDGLGWAASSPALDEPTRREVAELYCALLDGKLPRAQGVMRRVREEEVFYLGPETTVYTEMIPGLLDGLERIHGGAATGEALRRTILTALLAKWGQVSTYRVIWSPRTGTTLGELLGRLAGHDSSPVGTRLEIAKALATRVDNFQILGALSRLSEASPRSTELSLELAAIADRALEDLGAADYQDDDDQKQLLTILARLAHRPTLGADRAQSDARKKRILYAMFEGARKEIPGVVKVLTSLAADKVLPAQLAKDLEERLPSWLPR